MTEHIPDAVRTTIATLRTVAYWLPDADRAHLLETAHTAEIAWDGGCCPICQETFCDGECPLEEVRDELLRKAEQERLAATAKPTNQKLADLLWPRWTPFRMPVPIALDPPYQQPALPEACYDASFGRVHVRPGCRC